MGKIADISKWQGTIDWAKASKELDLVIIRVQYGSLTIDSKYKEYVAGAKKYNVPFGHYAYAQYVSVSDAIQEAKDFWKRADKSAQFYVVDVEEVSTHKSSDLVPATQAFIDYLHSQGAKKVGIYSGDSFYKTYGLSKVKADFKWIAQYGVNNGSPSTKPSVPCDLWQYTSKGRVAGISGNVDLNKINGSKPLSYFTQSTDSSNTGSGSGSSGTGSGTNGSTGGNTGSTGSPGTGSSSGSDTSSGSDDTDTSSGSDTNNTGTNETGIDDPSSGHSDNGGGKTTPIPYETTFNNPNKVVSSYMVRQGDKVIKPQIFLANPRRGIIGKISEANNRQLTLNFQSPNELTFSIPYQINIHNKLERNKIVDLLRERYLIKLVFAGIESWYIITQRNPVSDDTGEWLNVQCYSLEYELNYKKILNYNATSYNCLQVLNDALKGTNWSIGYINDEFNLAYKQFDVSSATVLDFINQICSTFDAKVIYDTVNRKVNICKTNEVSTYKGFWISYGKYLQNIDHSINNDEIVTRLYVTGSNGVSINSVNPTGQSYIDNFSAFMYPFDMDDKGNVTKHSYYMTDKLCLALVKYNNLVDENATKFNELLNTRKQLQSDLTQLQTGLSTLKEEYQELLDNIEIAKQTGQSTTSLIKQRNSKKTEINKKQTEINNKESEINSNQTKINNLNQLLSLENNFSSELLEELQHYIQIDEYSDDNQTNDEDLYEAGVAHLNKVCIPPININLDIVNFFEVLEEKANWSRLSIGDIIRIKHNKLKIDVKATVDQLAFDFENRSINITVTNITRPKTIQEKLSNALYVIDKVNTDYSKRKINWNSLLYNYNLQNDRISTPPANPVLKDNAVTHKTNDNGSVDLSLSWTYNDYSKTKKDADNIDGFIVYMYSDTSSDVYEFGSKIAQQTYVPLTSDQRTYTFPSVPPNRYYTLGIQAYRMVDTDISPDGYLFSDIITPSGDKQNPYLPSETIEFRGNLNGKLNGITIVMSETEPADTESDSTVWIDPNTKQINLQTDNGFEPASAGDATTLSGYSIDVKNTINTIPVRNSEGYIDASVLGDAASVAGKQPGIPNGLATLDSTGNIPLNQLNNTCRFACGTYTGDGTISKMISIPFTPNLIKVFTTDSTDTSLYIPSLAGGFLFGSNNILTSPLSTANGKIGTNCFYTGDTSSLYGNKKGVIYYWEAYKYNQ